MATLSESPSLAGSPSPLLTIVFFGVRVIKSSRVNLPLLSFRFNPKMILMALETIYVALETNFGH